MKSGIRSTDIRSVVENADLLANILLYAASDIKDVPSIARTCKLWNLLLNSYGEVAGGTYAVLMMILMAILGFLMVSTIRYSSFKSAGTGRSSIYLIIGLAAFAMGIWLYSKYVLIGLSVVYVSHGIIWFLVGILRPGKQVEAKEDSVTEVK